MLDNVNIYPSNYRIFSFNRKDHKYGKMIPVFILCIFIVFYFPSVGEVYIYQVITHPNYNLTTGCPINMSDCPTLCDNRKDYQNNSECLTYVKMLCYDNNIGPCFSYGILLMWANIIVFGCLICCVYNGYSYVSTHNRISNKFSKINSSEINIYSQYLDSINSISDSISDSDSDSDSISDQDPDQNPDQNSGSGSRSGSRSEIIYPNPESESDPEFEYSESD